MYYSSVDNPKIKEIKKLQQKKYRDKTGLFLVEGEHLVLEALKENCAEEVLVEENTLFPVNAKTSYLSNNVIHFLSELETSSNIMAICHKKEDAKELGDRIVILEQIQDPGNLGTIIRSCVAFHIDTLILSENCVDLYNPKVIRATQGLLFHLNIVVRDIYREIPQLKENGYFIYGTRVTYGKSLKNVSKREKFVIIMGNEGTGISEMVEENCDEFLYIDMSESCESLNVGVATSIILYELDK